ncbi:MAG: DUF99 family protein [Chromatiales bacterium]|jgi:hypothetical protein
MGGVRRFSQVVGIDDGPFPPAHRGDVLVVGAVFSHLRLEGVLTTRVRRDGANATDRLAAMIGGSRYAPQLQAVLLQGIALAGFNVIDLHRLHRALGVPLLVVSRRAPDLEAIRKALLENVPGGARKWQLIRRAGPMEALGGVHVQAVGLRAGEASELVRHYAVHSRIPEPLRTAHLIAGGLAGGESRQRV